MSQNMATQKAPIIKTASNSSEDLQANEDSSPAILEVQEVGLDKKEDPCSSDTHSTVEKSAEPLLQPPVVFPANQRVLITDPERWGDREPYVIYTIKTKKVEGGGGYWQVKRRFQDFTDLYTSLSEKHSDAPLILPPLPSKNNFEFKDKFHPGFIERRRKSLERFLNRLLYHPVLRSDTSVNDFLCQQNVVSKHANGSSSSIVVASSQAAGSGLSTVMEKFGDALAGIGIFSRSNQIEGRFERMKELCKQIENHYSKLESIFLHLYKAHKAMEEAMRMAGKEVMQAESTILQLREQLNLDSDPSLRETLTRLGVLYEDQADAMNAFALAVKSDLTTPIHEYYKYCLNAKDALKLRDEKQFNAEELAHYLTKSRHQLTELRGGQPSADDPGADHSMLAPLRSSAKAVGGYFSDQIDRMKGVDLLSAKQQKMLQIEKRITDLEQAVKGAKEASEAADETIEKEMEHFEAVLADELKNNLLPTLLDLHKGYIEKSSARWNTN